MIYVKLFKVISSKSYFFKKKALCLLSRIYGRASIHLQVPYYADSSMLMIFTDNYSLKRVVAQMVKNLPAMRATWVWSLGWEDPREEGMATHSTILAWRIPMDRGAWRATIHRVTKSQTQLVTKHTHLKLFWYCSVEHRTIKN